MGGRVRWKVAGAVMLVIVWRLLDLIAFKHPPGAPAWLGPAFALATLGLLAWAFLPRYQNRREAISARIGAGLSLLSAAAAFFCSLFLRSWYVEAQGFWLFACGIVLGMLPAGIHEIRRAAAKVRAKKDEGKGKAG